MCGRILAYQKGSTDAFFNSIIKNRTSIDSVYVNGVSVTHGPVGSRQHIWTFAAATYEEDPSYSTKWNCSCTNMQYNWPYQLLHSFRITTSAILEILDLATVTLTIILQILSEMEQDVDLTMLAVSSTILHGSSLLYHPREHQMTLN